MTQDLTVKQAGERKISKELTTYEGTEITQRSPQVVMNEAINAAKVLQDVISKKKKPVVMNGEIYLEFEDWQTVAQFYGYTVRTRDAEPVEIDGVKGAKAHADLIDIRSGLILGGAEAYCMRDEEHWNTRPKYEWQGEGAERRRVKVADEVVPWFQLASMAQTRSGAKAFRNRLAWVVVLAGYRPTPAEEMTEGIVSPAVQERRTVDKSQHWCKEHNVNYFKSGKMKGFAHKLPDGSWCNEPTSPQPSPAPLQSPTEPLKEAVNGNLPTTAERIGTEEIELDVDWLRETLKIIKWTPATAVGWIRSQFRVEGGHTLTEVLSLLTEEQVRIFLDHIGSMREVSGF